MHKDEFERKWRLYLREKEELEMMHEIIQPVQNMQQVQNVQNTSVSAPGGGGSISIVNLTAAEMLIYVDSDDQWKMVVANFDNSTISQPINTGILYDGGSSNIYARWTIAHGKGFMIIFNNGALSRTECFFVNSSGDLVDTIVTGGGFSYESLEAVGAWFADFEPDGQPTTEIIMKMFDGEKVTTHILPATSNISVGGNNGPLIS